MANSISPSGNAVKTVDKNSIYSLIDSPNVKERFKQVLDKNSGAYLGSVVNIVRNNKSLAECDPMSIIGCALIGATLNLPVDPNLGFSAIVPYKSQNGSKAQFQIMTKGFIQLAQRSGQYSKINVVAVYEDELKSYDPIYEELVVDNIQDGYREKGRDDKIVGFLAYFELVTGFRKEIFKTIAQLDAHGKKYSKSFSNANGLWKTDPNAMRRKTLLKELISKWGPVSVDYIMQQAVKADQATIDIIPETDNIAMGYLDNPKEDKSIEPKEEPKVKKEVKNKTMFDLMVEFLAKIETDKKIDHKDAMDIIDNRRKANDEELSIAMAAIKDLVDTNGKISHQDTLSLLDKKPEALDIF